MKGMNGKVMLTSTGISEIFWLICSIVVDTGQPLAKCITNIIPLFYCDISFNTFYSRGYLCLAYSGA